MLEGDRRVCVTELGLGSLRIFGAIAEQRSARAAQRSGIDIRPEDRFPLSSFLSVTLNPTPALMAAGFKIRSR